MSNKAKIWLYKEGNECSAISGGWDITATNLNTYVVGSITKNENSISFYNTMSQVSNIYCKNTFNYKRGYVVNAEINISNIYSGFSCSLLVHSDYIEGSAVNGVYTRFPMIVGRQSTTYTIPSDCNHYTVIHTPCHNGEITRIWVDCSEDVISLNYVDYDNLNISLNNINGLITFNQVNILTNGRIIQTYTENFDSITYEFVDSLMDWGNNEISIQAIYTQGDGIYEVAELISDTLYVREVILEELDPIVDLPSTSTLKEVIQRFSVIESTNKSISTNLKNLLESKGFSVGDTPRLSNMVKLVNELSNNNSAEITDYINRITELESENDDLNQELVSNTDMLYTLLVKKGVKVDSTDSFSILISKMDSYFENAPTTWYIYNEGVKDDKVTFTPMPENTTAPVYNSDHIYFYEVGGTDGRNCRLTFTIDVTKYSNISFDYTHNSNTTTNGFGITDSAGNNLGFTPSKTTTRVVTTVDLSNVVGTVTVSLGVSFGALNYSSMYRTTSVYKIWLEP